VLPWPDAPLLGNEHFQALMQVVALKEEAPLGHDGAAVMMMIGVMGKEVVSGVVVGKMTELEDVLITLGESLFHQRSQKLHLLSSWWWW